MSDDARPAAFRANFTSIKLVPSRGVMQLIFEVPSEMGQSAITALGGLPSPSHQPDVAIARLALPKGQSMDEETPDQEGRDAVIAAGIRPKEPVFQRWILGDDFDPADPKANVVAAQQAIRERCRIQSRTELKTDANKRTAWRALIAEYLAATNQGTG